MRQCVQFEFKLLEHVLYSHQMLRSKEGEMFQFCDQHCTVEGFSRHFTSAVLDRLEDGRLLDLVAPHRGKEKTLTRKIPSLTGEFGVRL